MDNFIKNGIGEWVSTHTQVEQVANNTWSIATTQIDAYGDTVYCFVEKNGNLYKIGDDSHILFKTHAHSLCIAVVTCLFTLKTYIFGAHFKKRNLFPYYSG